MESLLWRKRADGGRFDSRFRLWTGVAVPSIWGDVVAESQRKIVGGCIRSATCDGCSDNLYAQKTSRR